MSRLVGSSRCAPLATEDWTGNLEKRKLSSRSSKSESQKRMSRKLGEVKSSQSIRYLVTPQYLFSFIIVLLIASLVLRHEAGLPCLGFA